MVKYNNIIMMDSEMLIFYLKYFKFAITLYWGPG